MTYKHKEAFCLMWYACACGHRERIWNSRDGVTPFGGLLCVSCGGKGLEDRGLRHEHFNRDEPAPTHMLRLGQLYFRDGTVADAITIIKRRISAFAERGQAIPAEIAERLLEQARTQTGDEWNKGWPMLDRWDQAKANAALRSLKIVSSR